MLGRPHWERNYSIRQMITPWEKGFYLCRAELLAPAERAASLADKRYQP
jgi:hypothetical protein